MAAQSRITGTDLVVRFTPTGGSVQVLSGDYTKYSSSRKVDTVDVSAGNEKTRYFKPTLESMDISLDLFFGDQSYLPLILPRTEGLMQIYRKGVASGRPIESFNCLITGYDDSIPFDGAQEISISAVRQGDMINEVGSLQA